MKIQVVDVSYYDCKFVCTMKVTYFCILSESVQQAAFLIVNMT